MYYLGSRYYNPEMCRFINADSTDVLFATPMDLTDKNLFSYCDNNPIIRYDIGGEFWDTLKNFGKTCLKVGAAVIGTAVAVAAIATVVVVTGGAAAAAIIPVTTVIVPSLLTTGIVLEGIGISAILGSELGSNLMYGKKAKDSSKNEQHGDGGRAWAKAQKQIAELEEKLKHADCGAERKDIRQKIINIKNTARNAGKGVNHSQGNKR